ncbi:MAG: restriction endonuclease subunit S, partial [Schwartzia sp.]|nr:restriction endonuclease subunit S [Schwartzia sp. (in: firmicutes)]
HDILSSRLTPQRNDILLAKNGTTGVAALVDCEKTFDIYVSLALLRPKKSINPRFLLHAINSPTSKRQFNAGLKGIGVPNLHLNVIKNTIINVPSESKQSHIADCLDTIERLNNSRKQQLEKLDTLVKSRFIEMFGDLALNPMNWGTMPIVEVCANKDDIKCGPFGTQLGKHEYVQEGVPLWGIPQINAAFAIPPTDFLTKEKAEQLSAYSLVPGDIAMSRKGNVGKCAIYPDGEPNGIIHSDVLRIRVNSEVCNPIFLMCQLHFSYAIEPQIDAVSNGAVMAGINVTKLKNINVHVPPIEMQNQFAEFVQLADKSKSVLQKLLEKQELLRAALMQEYFG